jgi:hypothetical protein
MSDYTKGPWGALPWEQGSGGKDWNVWGPKATNHPGDDNLRGDYGSEADARLIAASPDLLESIKDLERFLSEVAPEYSESTVAANARVAISKAEGRAVIARAEDAPAALHKYQETYCSQCGKGFGLGSHGFSHCDSHRNLTAIST